MKKLKLWCFSQQIALSGKKQWLRPTQVIVLILPQTYISSESSSCRSVTLLVWPTGEHPNPPSLHLSKRWGRCPAIRGWLTSAVSDPQLGAAESLSRGCLWLQGCLCLSCLLFPTLYLSVDLYHTVLTASRDFASHPCGWPPFWRWISQWATGMRVLRKTLGEGCFQIHIQWNFKKRFLQMMGS